MISEQSQKENLEEKKSSLWNLSFNFGDCLIGIVLRNFPVMCWYLKENHINFGPGLGISGGRLFSAFESKHGILIFVLKLMLNKYSLRCLQAEVTVKASFSLACIPLLFPQRFLCKHCSRTVRYSCCYCCWIVYSVLHQNKGTCNWCFCFIKYVLLFSWNFIFWQLRGSLMNIISPATIGDHFPIWFITPRKFQQKCHRFR